MILELDYLALQNQIETLALMRTELAIAEQEIEVCTNALKLASDRGDYWQTALVQSVDRARKDRIWAHVPWFLIVIESVAFGVFAVRNNAAK